MNNFTLNMNSEACQNFKKMGENIRRLLVDNDPMQPDLLPFDSVMNALYEILRREHFTVPRQVVEGTTTDDDVTVLAYWTWLRGQKLDINCGYQAREHIYVVNSGSKKPIYCSITAINNCEIN